MASVYNIAKFDNSKAYVKNDIVLYDTDETNTGRTENHHWYATKDVPAGSTPSPTSDYWAGRVLDNGIQKPKFLWFYHKDKTFETQEASQEVQKVLDTTT